MASKGDYVAIEDNTVYNNTWWSSNAESAIVIADARHIDELDITKIFLNRNEVREHSLQTSFVNGPLDGISYFWC